jgi:NADH-quinone oxidoreductase subunit N
MAGYAPAAAETAVSSLAIYIVVYLFMNLGAFAIVAFLRNAMRSEEIADYAGLIRRCPLTVVCFAAILFSLVGLPPLSGFIGKFAIFASLVDGYQISRAAGAPALYLIILLVVGGINTAISLFYYLRVVKVMTMEDEPEERPPLAFSDVSLQSVFVWVVTAPTLLLILDWDLLNQWTRAAARHLLS